MIPFPVNKRTTARRPRHVVIVLVLALTALLMTGTAALAQEADEAGVLIVRVSADSPAAEAGLRRGAIMLSLGDTEVNSAADLSAALAEYAAGDEVAVVYLYGDEEIATTITLGRARGARISGGAAPPRARQRAGDDGTAPIGRRISPPVCCGNKARRLGGGSCRRECRRQGRSGGR